MFRTVSVVAALSVGLWVASARAQGTPFGGDDTGFILPAKSPTAKCEAKAAKAAGKLSACILKCHASRASGKLADDIAEDACEGTPLGLALPAKGLSGKSCFASFTTAISKLKGCPPCITVGTMATDLAGHIESLIDGNNSTVYCDTSSGTPFNGLPIGGDDPGDVPPAKSAIAKCEAGAAKAEGKLIACIDKCHASRFSGKLADDIAENGCEADAPPAKSCFANFGSAILKLKGCPLCITSPTMAMLPRVIAGFLNTNNNIIYCSASPSGAFVQ